MMQRTALFKSVSIAFLLLVCGFLFVLFSSLGSKSGELMVDDLQQLAAGQTMLRPVSGKRLWITRLNETQRKRLPSNHPCKANALCAIPAATQVAGIELVFSLNKPPQLSATQPWYGGFINPTNGAVYDLGGSAYDFNQNAIVSDLAPVFIN